MDVKIEKTWKEKLRSEFEKPYFQNLADFVKQEYKSKKIYPPAKNIFAAFNASSFDKTKVVIIGQDPYHGPNQANGLCFSVSEEVTTPPSLKNIYKEIENDLGKKMPASGNLERWAQQGVLLLNATLTVEAGKAASHQNKGWEEFTDAVIKILNEEKHNLVYLLWGSYAQKKGEIIDRKNNLVLESVHPSPLSAHRGFFGNKHFSKTNAYLIMHGKEAIGW